VAVIVLLSLTVKLVSPSRGGTVANGFSDAPFGPFAGYAWVGKVQSVGASFTVPRIATGSPLSEAGTWIGMQGAGPPARFVQIGAVEGRFWSRQEEKTVDVYTTFWSDTARHFKPQLLFPVSAGDALSASLTVANRQWTLAITDERSARKMRFSIGAATEVPFDQAEWSQEDPGVPNDHARYPHLAAPLFQHLTINSREPTPALYSQWMSVNHSTVAPTMVRDDSFTLHPAPPVSAAAAQYMRLFAPAMANAQTFEKERSNWTPKTPYAHIVRATLHLIEEARGGSRALLDARWSRQISGLVRSSSNAIVALLERARPPTLLTPASFAAWNSKLTEASERSARAASKLRIALGLPGFGFAATERRSRAK
jgi:hypothetical protein